MKKFFIVIFALLGTCNVLFAQSLTKEQEDLMRRRAAQKVSLLTKYIENIAKKTDGKGNNLSLEYRMYYKDAALKLFIGQGDAYDEIKIDSQGKRVKIEREGVLMEVTSVNRKEKIKYLIKKYFHNLANLRYSAVEIKTTDFAHMRVSNLEKVGPGTYKCVCFFKQSFVGYREGRPVYADITEKKVECLIFEEQTLDGPEYLVRLGDVTALETKKMNANTSTSTILDILNQ